MRCFECGEPIFPDDDGAIVCVRCEGRDGQYKKDVTPFNRVHDLLTLYLTFVSGMLLGAMFVKPSLSTLLLFLSGAVLAVVKVYDNYEEAANSFEYRKGYPDD